MATKLPVTATSMAAITDIYVIPPKSAHRYTMIFLHGRDDDPANFPESVLESETSGPKKCELPDVFPSMKWVFPASKIRGSLRFEEPMVQWFDMWSVEDPSEQEEIQKDGLRESISALAELIRQEAQLVPPSCIFLGGISQGSATAILTLLYINIKLGGCIGLCTWMPFQNSILEMAQKQKHDEEATQTSKSLHVAVKIGGLLGVVNRTSATNEIHINSHSIATNALLTPVFLSHSQNDEVVPIQNGRLLRECLEMLGMKVTWEEYKDGGHWIYEPDENIRNGVDDIAELINLHLDLIERGDLTTRLKATH